MIDFSNTEVAFQMKSNRDLRVAELLFSTIRYSSLVKLGKQASNIALSIKLPIKWAVKPTLYRQFVGGETLQECSRTLDGLAKYGVLSVLDYSAEGGSQQSDVDDAFEETLRSIDYAKGNRNVAYAVFKPTAMQVGEGFLARVAEEPESLSEADKKEFQNWRERMLALCKAAAEAKVRILIDAEEYVYQGLVDELVEEAMELHNKERAYVFATLQMYRHDRMDYLKGLHQRAKELGYKAGIKFVRGAYMDDERARAAEKGYPDPICKDKAATDANFNAGLRYVVEHIDDFELFAGSHNIESNQLLAQLIDEKGISHNDNRIFFSQLYGMSDNISFNLARSGYNVCKYLPYAPVERVLPYLIRRAEENTAMAGQTSRELELIRQELKRRKSVAR